jgi:hypothetical protein
MIRLTFIAVRGTSSRGPFEGRLELGDGVQVISAQNSYGKSLAAKAVAWCLGVEVMFGVPANDAAFFPDAVCEELDFPEASGVQVVSSECSIGLLQSDGRSLVLTRSIIGGDRTMIEVLEEQNNEESTRKSFLQTKHRSMQDQTGGFQHFFFEWMGWPRTKVMTFRGDSSELYLENLAPSFYIEQKEGWTALQALQVSRYSQLQIREIATEYLLGALDQIAFRVSEQEGAQQRAVLKEAADEIANRVNGLFNVRGWPLSWSSHGSIASVAKRWRENTLVELLKSQANVDLETRISTLTTRIEALRKALTTDPIDPADLSSMAAVSQQAIELKNERHRLNVELNSLKIQHSQAIELGASLDARIQSASDVLRLKSTGVGRLDHIECPTCHRDLDASTFSLSKQSSEEIEAHLEGLKRDRALIRSNATNISAAIAAQAGSISVVDERLKEAESTLTSVSDSIGTVREQLTRRAADLSAAEREQDRAVGIRREIGQLQVEIDGWLKRADALESTNAVRTDVVLRRARLQESLARYIRELGHSAVTLDNIDKLRIDEDYVPYLGVRRLHALGSASDQSRLIAAYSLAVADASKSLGGLHPGFVLLDEPLQQNPDDEHRELLFSSLTSELSTIGFQLVIFTWLPKTDIARLEAAGIQVLHPSGRHFLKLLQAPVIATTDGPSDSDPVQIDSPTSENPNTLLDPGSDEETFADEETGSPAEDERA